MRILFLSYYFQPELNYHFGLPFAKRLVELGHEVEVLTGFPNYPIGKIYDGYRNKPIQREFLDGVPVIRVPLYPSHDNSAVKRTLSYTSFALSAATIGTAAIKSAQVAYVVQGPATLGLPACIFSLIRRIPFVYDIKDLWPDSLVATGMLNSPLCLKLVGAWCNSVYRCASKIVATTPGIMQKLLERGVPRDKIEVIYNWCDDSQVCHVEKDQQLAHALGMIGRFNIVYAGNIGKAQSLSAVLDAADILAAENPRVQFMLVGGGIDANFLRRRAADMGLKNVLLLERRPMVEVGAILRLADVVLVHLKDDPLFRITIPGKTQAYMASGRPILMGVRGDAADLVTKAQAGLVCEPENPNSLAEAVRKFQAMPQAELDTMGKNGREFYQRELSLDIGVRKYERIFQSVARKPRRARHDVL